MSMYLETTVEKRFNSYEEAEAFGKQMDCYGSAPGRADSITQVEGKFKLRKYHKHAVVTDIETYHQLQRTFSIPALFPNQAFFCDVYEHMTDIPVVN